MNSIDPTLAPIESSLSWLGMPGLTAYFGLLDVGRPRPGDTDRGINPDQDVQWREFPTDILPFALQRGEIQAWIPTPPRG